MLFTTKGIGDVTTGPQPQYVPSTDPVYSMLDASLNIDAANQAAMDYYGMGPTTGGLANWFSNNKTLVGVALGLFVLVLLVGSRR